MKWISSVGRNSPARARGESTAPLLVGLVIAVSASPAIAQSAGGALRTFEVAKPPVARPAETSSVNAAPASPPRSHDSMQSFVGLGFVQGADWGAEFGGHGGFAGTVMQFNGLLTGAHGRLRADHGQILVHARDSAWRVEAGDLFSHLRGASIGGRLSWRASGERRPAIAVYVPRSASQTDKAVVSYRDQWRMAGQTLLDAEASSDLSHLLTSRFTLGRRLELEGTYRSRKGAHPSRDASVSAGGLLWRGISIGGGLFRSAVPGDRSRWSTIALRFPLARFVDVTLERAIAGTSTTTQTTSALMTSVNAGGLRFFHRQQYGEYDFVRGGIAGSVERQQTQSMTSYTAGPRMNIALQLVTQRSDSGQLQHWEELQTTLKVTSKTSLRISSAVPDVRNRDRFQAYLVQELPGRFALQADFGRVSAFRSVTRDRDRSRFKVMLLKHFDLATPAGGGEVSGRVLDGAGRGVGGVRVKLGPYSVDADGSGAYRFRHVPSGEYDLSLDRQQLPADVAWDGRRERLAVKARHGVRADLRVSPLNAVHGRVYVDRNGNKAFDTGEGLAGAGVQLRDRLTSSGVDGSYSFYNLVPDSYTVRLLRLPAGFEYPAGERTITLLDGGPVTGVDFIVVPKSKPIIWGGAAR